jgi:hypothetical protein
LVNYSVSGANNRDKKGGGGGGNAQYINLRPGLNIGPWRLRNYTTWNRNSQNGESGTSTKWDTVYTYAQRDIRTLKSRLTLGDSTTPSDIFDSIPFRGGQLASDDDMLPESLRGYAPVVRGSPVPMPRSRSGKTDTSFIRPTFRPAASKSPICTPPAVPGICTSPSKSLTAANNSSWCPTPRSRCCSAKAG